MNGDTVKSLIKYLLLAGIVGAVYYCAGGQYIDCAPADCERCKYILDAVEEGKDIYGNLIDAIP